MPRRDWRPRVADILHAARKLQLWNAELTLEQFVQDECHVDAALYNLVLMGEAAARVPSDVTDSFPEIPWAEMRDMLNILVHRYFGVDLQVVWQTIVDDVPRLITDLERVLVERGNEDGAGPQN